MNRLIALLLALLPLASIAAEPALRVDDPWIRAAPPGARMLAGYARLVNEGAAPVALVGAESARFGLVEVHRTVQVDGVARMRQVESLEIPAGGQVALEPGGLHLMLMRPVSDVAEGERIAIRLRFDDGSEHEAGFVVRRGPEPAAAAGQGAHQH